mmetsp:Transcript_6585/g.9620  ORF Transcript_6585/g.9620 Transcript_6585/m.9620 type:complete len:120 (-) Transcript_6585:68-427(-)
MDYKLHGKLIKRYQFVLALNFMPRIVAKVFRCVFPIFSSEMNYTFACFIMWYAQWKMIRENASSVRRFKYHMSISMSALLMYPFFECLKQRNVHFMSLFLVVIAQIADEYGYYIERQDE